MAALVRLTNSSVMVSLVRSLTISPDNHRNAPGRPMARMLNQPQDEVPATPRHAPILQSIGKRVRATNPFPDPVTIHRYIRGSPDYPIGIHAPYALFHVLDNRAAIVSLEFDDQRGTCRFLNDQCAGDIDITGDVGSRSAVYDFSVGIFIPDDEDSDLVEPHAIRTGSADARSIPNGKRGPFFMAQTGNTIVNALIQSCRGIADKPATDA